MKNYSVEIGNKTLVFETGKMAKLASGAVLMQYDETMVLSTAVVSKSHRAGLDFLPLTVDYVEKTFAAGKIPGGFFKREGRPTEKEIITSRFIDRIIRPLFPKGFTNEIQIIATVLSADPENDPDIAAMNSTSAALTISQIPFEGPVAGVRVGRINGEFILNPTFSQRQESELSLVVAGKRDAIVMVEGEVQMLPEEVVLDAIMFGHEGMQPIIDLQEQMREEIGIEKMAFSPKEINEQLVEKVHSLAEEEMKAVVSVPDKMERHNRLDEIAERVVQTLIPEDAGEDAPEEGDIKEILRAVEKKLIRQKIAETRTRIDGRNLDEIRPITCEIGLLPRTHGSALFTRGETQAMVTSTLGTEADEQRIDALIGEQFKSFMLHYNFPPFCTGEAKFLRGPGRREIGHGVLAERAIRNVLPDGEDFPYTIRIVSDILQSNGSSSMATVCGGILSLMDAGVPIKSTVAGVAMGLIKENNDVFVLSDILGDEDHIGDMDFKVAGTREGISVVQMDIKILGVTREILQQALEQAREGRLFILNKMQETISEPRSDISKYAPRIVVVNVNPDKIRDIIGPGGRTIRSLVDQTGAEINVEDDGRVCIATIDADAAKKAIKLIEDLTQEPEVGKLYMGTVKKIMDFGAFVEIIPGTDGLVHISQLANERVNKVTDILKEGDEVLVKLIEVDRRGKIRLSRKDALGMKLADD